jgi:plasmid stabilization system protein ParE
MTRILTILPSAEQDIKEAYDWYEGQEFGLGSEFIGCVEACIDSIQRNLGSYQIIFETYRRAVVRRFPYVIFYEYND